MYVLYVIIIVFLSYVTCYDNQGQRYSRRDVDVQPVPGVTVLN